SPLHRPPCSTLFPYTTLFRSIDRGKFSLCVRRWHSRSAVGQLADEHFDQRRGFGCGDLGHSLRYGCNCSEFCDSGNCALDGALRSEEHTSELQSLAYLVCRLL